MSQSLFIAFVMFATVMFFTPGPNNIMLLSSGLTYGFRPTIPHILGITIGFAFMIGAVGLGLGTIFIAYPALQTILKYAGVAYLVYLAWAIAMSEPPSVDQDKHREGRPMTFWGAAMFQWVNAKGWVMVIGTITAYAAIAAYPWNIAIQVGLSLILGILSCTAWALFGTALRPILTSPRAVRAFNIVMAVLLLASLYPVFMDA
ncbi:LysE family translocator [Bradyrhizobium australiense]|uniref:LysE family translocator n=1 Tax=Bradyrhizobium australiense TaxID=2721161 RepID=A0A7Y4GXM0_9BRAD|nr:LysE family translocator [Bradyrhizobium australiense]NOJ43567.1 LysE family translocator [Bradyrhizobium australiense]